MLTINNLHVTVDHKEVVKGVTLNIRPGEIHVLMGPNGSGKSSLAMALMGHPTYHVGDRERAPVERSPLPWSPSTRRGVASTGFGRTSDFSHGEKSGPSEKVDVMEFRKELETLAKNVGVTKELLHRSINVGFSGGEKKRLEILQMLVLQPKYAILDETDSGLDVDALRVIAKAVNRFVHQAPGTRHQAPAVLVITHYARLLKHLKPNAVHIMKEGRIIESGGSELAEKVEKKGYQISN